MGSLGAVLLPGENPSANIIQLQQIMSNGMVNDL